MPGLNLTRAEARERAALLNVESYDVTLDLTRGEKVFGSTTVMKFSATAGASTFIDAITDTVRSVTLNGVELDPAEVSDGVRIQLPNLAASNVLTVDADALYMNTGEGLHRFHDPADVPGEFADAGFPEVVRYGLEGAFWLYGDLDDWLDDLLSAAGGDAEPTVLSVPDDVADSRS